MQIWKYAINPDETQLDIPRSATLLSVQVQHGSVQLWALVDPGRPTEGRRVVVYRTGHPIPDDLNLRFIATFQLEGGKLIFHAFELVAREGG